MINCPNPSCKTANPEGVDTCQVCQSVLPHYYLWGVGHLVASLQPGTLLNQRYLLKHDRIFLDTKPGLTPESLPEIPDFLLPYLHLSAYPLHVPRLYSALRTPNQDYVLMLESSALGIVEASAKGGPRKGADKGTKPVPELLPRLINSWGESPPLRQLSWLSQLAQVWDAFAAEKVAATLLDSALLRVDGSIVRLLDLASPMPLAKSPADSDIRQPTLVDLSRSWRPLAESAHQAVRPFLKRLCEKLERQQLNAEQLSEQLSQAMTICAQGQSVAYDLSVHTDQGPTRKRNEDACFPENGTALSLSSQQTGTTPQLLIVCDGIGGHQGGDVASKLAIATIQQQLAPIMAADSPVLTSTELTLAIEAAICAANDEISVQNDQAQRQARDRMGTTLVLAYVQGAEVYIAHLGDSRAYRISHHNCQQVTLDDDVASRQVRLGGSLYREVLIQPGSGSLIQALGMGPSQALRPTVQRFVIDQTCTFLLCSDGLSDSDRVEQFWQQELSPLVNGDRTATEVGPRLVTLANKYNGHDNVTVGLLKAKVTGDSDRIVPRELTAEPDAATATAIPGDTEATTGQSVGATTRSRRKVARPTTQLAPVAPQAAAQTAIGRSAEASSGVKSGKTVQSKGVAKPKRSSGLKILAAALLLLAITGGLAFAFIPGVKELILPSRPGEGAEPNIGVGGNDGEDGEAPGAVLSRPLPTIEIGNYFRVARSGEPVGIRVEREDADASTAEAASSRSAPEAGLAVYVTPESGIKVEVEGNTNEFPSVVSVGSVLRVESARTIDGQKWLRIQLCSQPGGVLQEGASDEAVDTFPNNSEVDPRSVVENVEQPISYKLGDDPGWISEERLKVAVDPIESPSAQQKGICEG